LQQTEIDRFSVGPVKRRLFDQLTVIPGNPSHLAKDQMKKASLDGTLAAESWALGS
jgi:hypothetical protein